MRHKKIEFDPEIVREFYRSQDMNERQFAESLGIKPTVFNRYMNGRSKLGEEAYSKIEQKYPYLIDKLKKKKDKYTMYERVYFVEHDVLNYVMRYNQNGEIVLRSSKPDECPDVKITYTKIEPI